MLSADNLRSGYGRVPVLRDVSLTVGAGEAASLLGRNGMGKTTTVRTLFGLLPLHGGRLSFAGTPLVGMPTHRIARLGLGLVPEGRQVFPTLTVVENLLATAARHRADQHGGSRPSWSLARVFALFPQLAERRGAWGRTLSGGEQQMLAIGRALMINPRLLVLDEATEGLAPLVRREIWGCLAALKADGLAILVIDKDTTTLERLVDRHHVLEKGRTVWAGTAADFAADPSIRERYLGL